MTNSIQEPFLSIRRTFKDSVFCDLFGSEERKENALSLYNALNKTSYDDPESLELTTIGNVIYMRVKNDVSFLIGNEQVLWEHQSTHNPNMPLRGLLYFARLYESWVHKNEKDIFSGTRINLPRPAYVVFYIGAEDRPEREVLRLSDSFMTTDADDEEPVLEVLATVININEGKNRELADACKVLADYAHFIALVREERENGRGSSDAVDNAIERCISEGCLADYLGRRRAEVKDLLLTEFDQELHDRTLREEGRAEGREEGRVEGHEEGFKEGRVEGREEGRAENREEMLKKLSALVVSGELSVERLTATFGLSEEEVMRLDEALASNASTL